MTRVLRALAPLALVVGSGLVGLWQGSAVEAAPSPDASAPTVTVDLSGLNRAVKVGQVRVLAISPEAEAALRRDRPGLSLPRCGGLTSVEGVDLCVDGPPISAGPAVRPRGSFLAH